MNILILGSHSFSTPGIKVGIQFIAEHLAKSGNNVSYISVPSSPIDILSQRTRQRFKKAWMNSDRTLTIRDGLTEFFVKSLWTSSKLTFRYEWQTPIYGALLPENIKKTYYDIVIHDSSTSAILLESISSKKYVYRVNDTPKGFEHHTGKTISKWFDSKIKCGFYDAFWVSSHSQIEQILELNKLSNTIYIPNGYDSDNYSIAEKKEFENGAVFIGAISEWIDFKLIEETAAILEDWNFDFYGPNLISYQPTNKNIRMLGPIDNKEATKTLSRYAVGLIPYKNKGHVSDIERPIKFYEYIAAHLGVAATDIPSFRKGMGNMACFGANARDFAECIRTAKSIAASKNEAYFRELIDSVSWKNIFSIIDKETKSLWK